jgi:hypothetical protein
MSYYFKNDNVLLVLIIISIVPTDSKSLFAFREWVPNYGTIFEFTIIRPTQLAG